ncbi:MAG: M23 family metallopeptidase [Helicobacteraceae bacterium]|jgi:murein DD-endopeptidase MepM/ murein hydrolase activator NlpD|nr:M23 family metallopeptidase [Helicobacteraceae bacterium]
MKSSLLCFLFAVNLFATSLPESAPFPGGVIVQEVESAVMPEAYLGKRQLMVLPSGENNRYFIVAGVSLNAKVKTPFKVTIKEGEKREFHSYILEDKAYEKQYIVMKNKRKVSPQKQDMKRIQDESLRSRKALALFSPKKFTDLLMVQPVDVNIRDDFGKRRFFNNKPRRPHSGVDMPAPVGTEIVAPLAGKIVEIGEFFFNGNVIFIDHGLGLVSMYCHMHKFDVQKGQLVKKGEKIGEVGATGRVTGPHLHWGVSLNGAMVDPRLFFVKKK